uniref:Odorant receptor n=1 Tax=Campoletis chlorideae TaxID=219166 RepID=A0A346D3W0_9HYME|nr:odorant receptor [Campoletis chlorideae]
MKKTTDSGRSTHRQALDATITSLRYSGLWVFNNPTSWFEKIYKLYNKLVTLIVCIFALTVFFDLCFNYDDLIILTDDGCILAGICVIIFKIYTFQTRSKRIKNIIETIHTPIDTLNRSSDPGVQTVVRTCSFYEKLLLHGFWAIGGILSVALIFLVPVEKGDLPIRAKYPFDVRISPMHEIAFFVQACAVSIGLMAIIGMDSMVIGLYKWINVQLVILNANYENCLNSKSKNAALISKPLPPETDLFSTSKHMKSIVTIDRFIPFNENEVRAINDHDSFVRRFKICIINHQRLINGVDELNDLFSTSMSVQLFSSFSMICFTGFQAVLGAKNLTSLLKFGVYLGAAFSQLLNWCWTGNSLVYQSASLSTSQWLSGWEDNHTPEVIHLLIISLMRSKKPLSLKAGKFYTMSMETFIAILRSSYSFFALLTEVSSV